MTRILEKIEIIKLKEQGLSNREVSKRLGCDRGTVSKYWKEYQERMAQLERAAEANATGYNETQAPESDVKTLQETIFAEPKYKKREGKRRKYTEEVAKRLKEILAEELRKDRKLGENHKQKLTNKQIHEKLVTEGHDISNVTINIELAKIRTRSREVFIRQEYALGDRLEYDFGEVLLDCGKGVRKHYMAVLSSPGGKFRWLYLYTNQKKAVFMDSQVRFFAMMGGVYLEVVYDNMRNVVRKFIGKNEKELNDDLVKLSVYYGFKINVTNCFKGNEKGHVESSVKILRKQLFAVQYEFESLEAAQEYAQSQLLKLNENSLMEEEKQHLKPSRPPLELAIVVEAKVNPSSLVSVDSVQYSVPEHLVGKRVMVKKYHDEIRIYAENEQVAKHKRTFIKGEMQINIYHYLNTFVKKPGALRNSIALKRIPRLKAIFDTHYANQPKKFIEKFLENKALPIEKIIEMFERETVTKGEINALDVVKPVSQIDVSARASIAQYVALVQRNPASQGGDTL